MRTLPTVFLLAGLSLTAAPAVAAPLTPGHPERQHDCTLPTFTTGTYAPTVDGDDFTADVDNPWFPLPPGETQVSVGVKDAKHAVDVFHVTRRVVVLDGVPTRVVDDRLYLNGVLTERTSDYYSQDECGNVWYFGEDTAELDPHGRVDNTDGSWRAAVHGAQPGVYMQADPQVGRRFRQEWAPKAAEDVYRALSLRAAVTVPAGSFTGSLRTEETTALEPGVVDNKYYVRGIGQVEEAAVRGGGDELLRLVDVLR
ncbi:MAG: hypothetical protein ACTHJ6_00715 [Oryzihumus sp.]